MLMKIGSSFETQMVNKARTIYTEGGIKALALAVYQGTVSAQALPFDARKKADVFFAGLVYSEFYAETSSDEELLACEDLRQVYGRRIGVDNHHLFLVVENLFRPGHYEYPADMTW